MKLRKFFYSYISLLILVCLFIGIGWMIFSPELSKVSQGVSQAQLKSKLLEEFNNSYTESVKKTDKVIDIDLIAAETEVELLPGEKTKVWTYNGQVPGPEIHLDLGDTLKVHLTNNLPQATTIHWHGVRVPNDMDGVPEVTQDSIAPGESFTYTFTPKDAGTFWFHPHVRGSEQVERGLYGVLVVNDPDDPDFDTDQTLVLDDWRMLDNGQIGPRFNTGGDLMHDGRWGNVITVDGDLDKQLSFDPGSENRLRFVNTSNGRVYALDFGRLEAQVIAVDGMKVDLPFDAQGFEVSPGNRLDVVVSIPQDAIDKQFKIRDIFTRNTNTLISINTTSKVRQSVFDLPTADHYPDWSEAYNLEIDKEYVLDARRAGGMGMMAIEWTINGKAYPDVDPLKLKHNTVNKIRFTNKSGRLHPMHLHGQFFRVIARNGQRAEEPFWRDTVLVHPKESVDIVLVPLDKGSWVSHCHILEHAEAGMMTVVEVVD